MSPQQDQEQECTGDDSTPEDAPQFNQIPLEVLLTSPILWQGSTCCDFFNTVHNLIKEDKKMVEFKATIDSNHTKNGWDLWCGQTNWKSILGEEIFKLVTTYRHHGNVKDVSVDAEASSSKSGRVWDTTSVIELMRIIRNKCEHNADYSDNDKKKLNWYRRDEIEGGWKFSQKLYAKFWVTKFPQLLCYLWWQFRTFRNSEDICMKKFYPYAVEMAHDYVMSLPCQIHGALQKHLEDGSMETRFMIKNGETTWTLEIRTLQNELVSSLLDGNSSVEISVSRNQTICRWLGKEKCLVDERVTNLDVSKDNISSDKLFEGNIIVACELEKVDYDSVVEIISGGNENQVANRIIIFTSSDHSNDQAALNLVASKILKENEFAISEIPVNWEDLREPIKNDILNESELRIQNKVVKFTDSLFGNDFVKKKLLSHLNGSLLNQILRKGRPVILEKLLELPQESDDYVERRLCRYIGLKSPEYLSHIFPDLSLITNITLNALKRIIFCEERITVVTAENLWQKIREKSRSSVFLIEGDLSDLKVFEGVSEDNKRIHCLRHFQGRKFELMGIINFHSTKEQLSAISNFENVSREVELANIKGPIFISDKPGMGKSLFLANLATILCKKFGNRLVVYGHVNQFIDQLLKKSLTRNGIIEALLQLSNLTNFEAKFVELLLGTKKPKKNSKKISFEILLDGLDEIGMEKRVLAFNAFQTIQCDLPSVRLWVSLRDHMVDSNSSIMTFFNYKHFYKLVPFSQKTQVEFLVNYWLEKCNGKGRFVCSERLRNFAKRCVQISFSSEDAQVVGIPLHCKILGEIYESKVIERNFNWNETSDSSLVDLYEKLIKRKIEIYVREKKGISESCVPLNDILFNPVRDQFELNHFYFALQLIMGNYVTEKFRNRLLVTARNKYWLDQTVLEQGIIQKLQPLTFIHRTLAEFFVARFVVKVLSGQLLNVSADDQDFKKFLWESLLVVYWNIFDEMDPCPTYFTEIQYPTVCHFLNALWERHNFSSWSTVDTCTLKNLITNLDLLHYHDELIPNTKLLRCAAFFHTALRKKWNGIISLFLKSQKHLLGLLIVSLINQKWPLMKYLIHNQLRESWDTLQEHDRNRYGIFHYVVAGVHRPIDEWSIVEMTRGLEWLLEKDWSLLEQKDRNGYTPLLLLLRTVYEDYVGNSYGKCLDFIKVLVTTLGADAHAVDKDYNTVLHYVVKDHDDLDYDVDLLMRFGEPDYEAKLQMYLKVVKLFMRLGCNEKTINKKNRKGQTPLYACVKVFGELVKDSLKTFREYGADFNIQDWDGRTVLHAAIEKGLSADFVSEMICCGADIYVMNYDLQNCIELAKEMGNVEILKILNLD